MFEIKEYLNEENEKLNVIDYILLSIIVIIYAIISFINLGSYNNPNSFINVSKSSEIVIKLRSKEDIIKMKIFNGEENTKYQIYTSINNKNYNYHGDYEGSGSFSWDEVRLATSAKYVKLLFLDSSSIGEIGLYNNSKNYIPISKVIYNNKSIKVLNDEASDLPKTITYMNSTYFDEIYFARTAYDYANNIKTYEWTHPPLGKLIQAIPIYMTKNFSPFNYRLMGNIAGILLIILMYFYGHLLFKKRKYALASALLMMFDTFHFAQTRMGTVDSHLVLFILFASYFMIKYIKNNKEGDLVLSGIFFGFSISVKWTGFYGGLALAIIYISYLIKSNTFNTKSIIKGASYFIIIPILIYCSLYLLFPNNGINYTNNLKSIIEEQKDMYNYHANLRATHPFSSPWYSWPICYKPVWYYQKVLNNNTRQTIVGVGSISIWWIGIISYLYLIIKLIRKKDKISYILLISIISLFLPYAFIGRIMFLYHYFPILPFMYLAIVCLLKDIEVKYNKKWILPCYMAIILINFIIYYPVVSGMSVTEDYIDKLRLFSSWIF